MLPLPKLVEELVRYREASKKDTIDFNNWNHDRLCHAFQHQLDTLGDSFLKYHHVTYLLQGPRDQGVDVLLKTTVDDETEGYLAIQVKSYAEIEDKKNDLSKQLKAGYHDARNHYGTSLGRYYIALCGDAQAHAKRIAAITGEFAKEHAVRVIGPRHLFTFLTMPDARLSAIVDRFLKADDVVRKQARSEVRGYTDSEIYFHLACLVWSFEHGTNLLESEFFERSSRIQDLKEGFGGEALERALGKFQDITLETYAESSATRVRLEDFPAIRALYYDVQVRYGEQPNDLFTHLYEFLKE